jgi:hydroxymethylpyrimidine/phosphomethylpyrimidine kinase
MDLLFDGRAFTEFRTPRVDAPDTHGTGCTYASAVAAHLALGRTLPEAAGLAQTYVAGAIGRAIAIGKGGRVLGHL